VSLEFFPEWQNRETISRRAWESRALSAALHLVVILLLVFTPLGHDTSRNINQVLTQLKEPVILVAPPRELTQTAPNRGKVAKEVDLASLQPRPRVFSPPPLPPGAAPSGGLVPLPEPPKLDIAQTTLPPSIAQGPGPAAAPPATPQIQTSEKPKLALPGSSISEIGRDLARGRGLGAMIVTDIPPGLGGMGGALSPEPAPGQVGSSLELLSDPKGVDFRPYLIRILAAVKRNWTAVIPESAKMGRRGRTVIQFVIDRDGSVPKLVIASASGADALDRAAVAGISATNPFPPLPAEFKGNEIRLQFVFLYNMNPF
jgi:TonB family protein